MLISSDSRTISHSCDFLKHAHQMLKLFVRGLLTIFVNFQKLVYVVYVYVVYVNVYVNVYVVPLI